MNKSLTRREIKGRVGVSKKGGALVRILLLLILNLLTGSWLESSSYFLMELAEGLTQKLD